VEQIAGVEQALGVDDQATGLKRDAGKESAGPELCKANREADLAEPIDNSGCGGIEHRLEFSNGRRLENLAQSTLTGVKMPAES
jgi:hypothetical protein